MVREDGASPRPKDYPQAASPHSVVSLARAQEVCAPRAYGLSGLPKPIVSFQFTACTTLLPASPHVSHQRTVHMAAHVLRENDNLHIGSCTPEAGGPLV